MRNWITFAAAAGAALAVSAGARAFTLEQALAYPFVGDLTLAPAGGRVAWIRIVRGVRNIWVADTPGLQPRQVTSFTADDGQELSGLVFSADGRRLLFVRGGDHDANWPAKGDLAPDPASSPDEPKVEIWLADPVGGTPARKLVEGDAPAISARGELAFLKAGQVWTANLDGSGARRLFFDRGKDASIGWSPDGARLAFVSGRDDHAFVGVFSGPERPIAWMAPSSGRDRAPVWSKDGARLAFVREPGLGGAPEPRLTRTPYPWSIWTADASTGAGRLVWASGRGLRDSIPTDLVGEAMLQWADGGTLVFRSSVDGWPHLYTVADAPGPSTARLLTPGAFMVEDYDQSPDGREIVYTANAGPDPADDDRRHLFAVAVAGGAPRPMTSGEGLEWEPALPGGDLVVFIGADARRPPTVEVETLAGADRHVLPGQAPPPEFAGDAFVVPRRVTFRASDGLLIHGQLFQAPGAAATAGLVFVHGGASRQMLLGWSRMDYYTHAYAMNQYYASHGYTVLSVNYRLGIGYGYDFQHDPKGGARGASEYQDVLAGARWLQGAAGVDPKRIGIWGGSYGGYLTALALARNSDVFKAGVDLHGLHDWSLAGAEREGPPLMRFEQGDRAAWAAAAFAASPDADVARWTSPVLLIQGDDDRNVRFDQFIDLKNRLDARGVPVEELVLPDEIHGFLRYASWLEADQAAADFFARKLGGKK